MWSRVKHIARLLLGGISVATFVVLVLVVLWGVFTRHVMQDQVRWSEELARLLLVWISFLGGAIAYIDDKHLGVDLFVSRLDPAAARVAAIFCHLLVLGFGLFVMGVGGTRIVMDRFDSGQLLPALQLNRAWFYLAIPVSGWLISLFAVGNLIAFSRRNNSASEGDLS
jgi:TRAP-type C4-dicarboxylate transport system permease small subunit